MAPAEATAEAAAEGDAGHGPQRAQRAEGADRGARRQGLHGAAAATEPLVEGQDGLARGRRRRERADAAVGRHPSWWRATPLSVYLTNFTIGELKPASPASRQCEKASQHWPR